MRVSFVKVSRGVALLWRYTGISLYLVGLLKPFWKCVFPHSQTAGSVFFYENEVLPNKSQIIYMSQSLVLKSFWVTTNTALPA